MTYKITIKETREVTKTFGNDWAVVGKDESGKEVRGYTPEREKQVTETVKIYQQTVEVLDLEAVIRAVNGMQEPTP